MDVDAAPLLQQLPQIATRLQVKELRLEAKQAERAKLSAADYKPRTGEFRWGTRGKRGRG